MKMKKMKNLHLIQSLRSNKLKKKPLKKTKNKILLKLKTLIAKNQKVIKLKKFLNNNKLIKIPIPT